MITELLHNSHYVGEGNSHIQLTPAYHQAIFSRKLVRELTPAYIAAKLKELGVKTFAYDFAHDHLHLFVCDARSVGEIELVRQIKGYSLYMLRKGLLGYVSQHVVGHKLWSKGHRYRSVGMVTRETMPALPRRMSGETLG